MVANLVETERKVQSDSVGELGGRQSHSNQVVERTSPEDIENPRTGLRMTASLWEDGL
jgi:hypothetical protein